jgi:hypothetical protein
MSITMRIEERRRAASTYAALGRDQEAAALNHQR